MVAWVACLGLWRASMGVWVVCLCVKCASVVDVGGLADGLPCVSRVQWVVCFRG